MDEQPTTADELVLAFFEDPRDAYPWIDRFGPDQVVAAIARTIGSGPQHEAAIALGFLRDACRPHGHAGLRAAYLRSELVDRLRDALTGTRWFDRGGALQALAELGPPSNAAHFERVLPWYEAHDPFQLEALHRYLGWWSDGRGDDRRRLTALARSRHHLARWATVAILWEHELGRGIPGWEVQLMRQLAQDPHPWVRDDARWALAERRRHRHRSGEPRRVDDELGPVLRFEQVERLVGGHLNDTGRDDYDAELVDAAARHLARYPDALREGRRLRFD